jgi:hypothetical protein
MLDDERAKLPSDNTSLIFHVVLAAITSITFGGIVLTQALKWQWPF